MQLELPLAVAPGAVPAGTLRYIQLGSEIVGYRFRRASSITWSRTNWRICGRIYAPKVSIPLEGKVPTSSGGPDLQSPTLGDEGGGAPPLFVI